MYHSSATLLPDGSVLVSGSNPNSDCETPAKQPRHVLIPDVDLENVPDAKYVTQYQVEIFYPD